MSLIWFDGPLLTLVLFNQLELCIPNMTSTYRYRSFTFSVIITICWFTSCLQVQAYWADRQLPLSHRHVHISSKAQCVSLWRKAWMILRPRCTCFSYCILPCTLRIGEQSKCPCQSDSCLRAARQCAWMQFLTRPRCLSCCLSSSRVSSWRWGRRCVTRPSDWHFRD